MQHAESQTIKITVEGKDVDYLLARRISEDLVATIVAKPILIAWFDGKKGEEHPEVPECQHKPGWLAYAKGHGGRIRVDVNEAEYSYIFAEVAGD